LEDGWIQMFGFMEITMKREFKGDNLVMLISRCYFKYRRWTCVFISSYQVAFLLF